MGKVTDSRIAYYIDMDENNKPRQRLITTDDALMYIENGISLRNCLFDVKEKDNGNNVPLKFVSSVKRRSYFSTKALTLNTSGVKNVSDGNSLLHDAAKKFLSSIEYERIDMGVFKIHSSFIYDVEEEVNMQFKRKDDTYGVLRPDVIIYTPFQDIFVEIIVTHGVDDDKLSLYKEYRKLDIHPNAFSVFTIDLSDLHESVKLFGITDEIMNKVKERILTNNEYKQMLRLISFNIKDAPFGWSRRTGLPFKLLINKAADGVNKRLAELITNNSDIKTSICYNDGLYERDNCKPFFDNYNMLYLTDDSAEHPLYSLMCPLHVEEPLKLVMQSDDKTRKNRGMAFIKCNLYNSDYSIGVHDNDRECNFTLDFCSDSGIISDEYLVIGDLSNLLYKNKELVNRIAVYRDNIEKYRNRGEGKDDIR